VSVDAGLFDAPEAAAADFHNTGQLWSSEEYTLVQQGHTSMVQMFAPLSSYDGGGQFLAVNYTALTTLVYPRSFVGHVLTTNSGLVNASLAVLPQTTSPQSLHHNQGISFSTGGRGGYGPLWINTRRAPAHSSMHVRNKWVGEDASDGQETLLKTPSLRLDIWAGLHLKRVKLCTGLCFPCLSSRLARECFQHWLGQSVLYTPGWPSVDQFDSDKAKLWFNETWSFAELP
ncbi:hypothetical protein RRG08_010412, partial [Elysia crispata]